MIKSQQRIISKFMGASLTPDDFTDWNFVMRVVDKIEGIIGHSIDIHNEISIYWWYSPKKTGTFPKGAGGGGGWTEKRTPFEAIFGKHHDVCCYYQKGLQFKPKKNELAETKKEAVLIVCFRWIEWYNKNVLKKVTKK